MQGEILSLKEILKQLPSRQYSCSEYEILLRGVYQALKQQYPTLQKTTFLQYRPTEQELVLGVGESLQLCEINFYALEILSIFNRELHQKKLTALENIRFSLLTGSANNKS